MCKNCKIDSLKAKHLKGNPGSEFELIISPSSGETFPKFKSYM